MTKREREIFELLADARQQNFHVFSEMAKLVDAESIGFKSRRASRDVTLELMKLVIEEDPELGRQLLRKVVANDKRVVALAEQLIDCGGGE